MRAFLSEARLHSYARSVSPRSADRLFAVAVYGALGVIAFVVFGTLSHHPF
ncbi:hypothetical protein JQ557_19425 [Bradyrhizobium sp. U87765 SZCCT0131]|uniref:hypothetical protein n=1 Tax=unclassified Bradyrhizobium TaxID=2631580 RepID=UPI001BAB144F|nr:MULTISPECIES: hypothetical protein [unclassified Bradyrhizobium]MBR1220185.1 hypothetical protein [Bradyrhizobium sp. U87765 SZCCT0131]MBR1263359.1 hypothetical protein [Bradyrhizobium sp. U87765 SZCCT0134]MBR1306758.1 hypothetical protein [Bradyrhizobium sp. U87765 SZCCT0110]MBR1323257.1 hypothetical protein [Bradyrhizobium sp. U87765 SZCCT0109]MBR1345712.1 hypothetical protein [Bradyrhizobium sp. U87765 SZCCT0048]